MSCTEQAEQLLEVAWCCGCRKAGLAGVSTQRRPSGAVPTRPRLINAELTGPVATAEWLILHFPHPSLNHRFLWFTLINTTVNSVIYLLCSSLNSLCELVLGLVFLPSTSKTEAKQSGTQQSNKKEDRKITQTTNQSLTVIFWLLHHKHRKKTSSVRVIVHHLFGKKHRNGYTYGKCYF